jgi:transposase
MRREYCEGCFEKQREIDTLKYEIERLKDKLAYQERTAREGYFGSSTPSSKIPIKANTLEENQKKKGGAKPGHKGYGRSAVKEREAEEIEEIPVECTCPDCGVKLENKVVRKRTVIDCETVKVKKKIYRLPQKKCPMCGRTFKAVMKDALPKSLYSNRFLTHTATEHYLRGIPLGRLEEQMGVNHGGLINAMHRLAGIFSGVPQGLIKRYRVAPVKHADETGWRNDGKNGYAWLFADKDVSIYRFAGSRSAAVPKEIFGGDKLPGVLVVDRYNGYNKMPCEIQYCYAHLLREVQDLENELPDNREIKAFANCMAPLLSEAMGLRAFDIGKREFKRRAGRIKRKIIKAVKKEAKHPGIQRIQDIFRRNSLRLYHWARDRDIPADNNLAERELRPLVIARKLSFGSQSDAGARTREILMTVLHTLKKQNDNPAAVFLDVLEKLSVNPDLNIFQALFHKDVKKDAKTTRD